MHKVIEDISILVMFVGGVVCLIGVVIAAIIGGVAMADFITDQGPLIGLSLMIGGGAAVAWLGYFVAGLAEGNPSGK